MALMMACSRQVLVVLSLAAWVAGANGFPVPTETSTDGQEAAAPPEATDAASTPAPPTSMPGEGRRSLSASEASKPQQQGQRAARGDNDPKARDTSKRLAADSASGDAGSGAVITADVQREAEATRQTMTTLDAVLAPLDEADQASLRQTAQSVVTTARESIAWLRPAVDGIGSVLEINDFPSLLSAMQVSDNFSEGRVYDRGNLAGASTRLASGGSGYASGESVEANQRADVEDPGRNTLREAIQMLRTALQHPMSWFVIALVAIATLAVSGAKRWLK